MSSRAETISTIAAEACKVADSVDHENRKYRRNREQAAAIVSEAIGVPYGGESLRKADCPYISVAGRVLYSDQDLIELATAILARAQKRGSTPKSRVGRCTTPPFEAPVARASTNDDEQDLGLAAVMNKRITEGPSEKFKRGVGGRRRVIVVNAELARNESTS